MSPPRSTRLDQVRRILASKDTAEHPICGSKGEGALYTRVGMVAFASTTMAFGDEPAL